jgi:hypothetical protein
MFVDGRKPMIVKALTRSLGWVSYCERCGQVCDRECRAKALRSNALDLFVQRGMHP